MTVHRTLFHVLLACIALSGCYRFTPLHPTDASTISVGVFKNNTFWREIEFDLAKVLTEEVAARGLYRVEAGAKTDIGLEGAIIDYRQPVVTEGVAGHIKEGAVIITVKVTITDCRTGECVAADRELTETATYVLSRGETAETARVEAFRLLSENILNLFIQDW